MSKFICDVFSFKPSTAIVTTWRACVYLVLFVLHKKVILHSLDSVAPRKPRRDFKTRREEKRVRCTREEKPSFQSLLDLFVSPIRKRMNARWSGNRQNRWQLVWITFVARAIRLFIPMPGRLRKSLYARLGVRTIVIKSLETLLSSSLLLA